METTAILYDFVTAKRMSEEFRFKNREEYEMELKNILDKRSSEKKRDSTLEELYDSLLEEYLRFCATDKDG